MSGVGAGDGDGDGRPLRHSPSWNTDVIPQLHWQNIKRLVFQRSLISFVPVLCPFEVFMAEFQRVAA